jgi:transcriptional regulator with XRE-family HTH domain
LLNKFSGMTLKERLQQFLTSKGLSQGRFEKAVGLSTGFVNNVGEGISTQSLIKILKTYPDLSGTWLLTEAGEMILQENFVLLEDGPGYKKQPAPGEAPVDLLTLRSQIGSALSNLQEAMQMLGGPLGPETSAAGDPAFRQPGKKKKI